MKARIRTYCGSYEKEIPPSYKTGEVSSAFYSDNKDLIAIARYRLPTGEIHDVYVSPDIDEEVMERNYSRLL